MADSPDSAQPPSQQAGEDSDANRRRSSRLFVTVPVTISGKNARGEPFREETWTTVINKQGASIATSQQLAPGSEIVIENPPLWIQVKARVVRFSGEATLAGVHHAGVELMEQKNVWGIQYPPADWRAEMPNAGPAAHARDELAGSPAQPPASLPSVTIELPSELAIPDATAPFVDSSPVDSAAAGGPHLPDQSQQPGNQVKELLRDATVTLATMGQDIDARVESRLQEALARLSEEQNSFAQRMYAVSADAAETSAQLEALISRIEDAARRSREESDEARDSLQEVISRALTTIPEEAGRRISQRLEAAGASYLEESRQRASAYMSDLARGIKQEFGSALHTLAGERLSATARELEARRVQAVGGTEELMGAVVKSSLNGFDEQIRQRAETLLESVLRRRETEDAARVSAEFENRRSEAAQKFNEQSEEIVRANVDRFKTQIQASADELRGPAISMLARQSAEKVESEIMAMRAAATEESQNQIRSMVESGMDHFRSQLTQAAQQSRDSALASFSQDLAANAAATYQECQLTAGRNAQNQAREAARAALEEFQARLDQAAEKFRGSVLPDASNEFLAEISGELKRSEEASVCRATENMQQAAQSAINNFGELLAASTQNCREKTEEILKLPAAEIGRYAEDALSTAREQISGLRGGLVNETREQLATMTRGTLASMTSEAKALMEEYRGQLRGIFDALREKSSGTVESCVRGALEKGREQALRQIQKDAEDFSTVAVAQFRSQSGEALRAAADAVNKQVGSAAFVVKDWLDQATQRLDAHLSNLEARSDAALQDIEDRSQKLSRAILTDIRKESENLMADLRTRIQNAAGALIPSSLDRPSAGCVSQERDHDDLLRPSHS